MTSNIRITGASGYVGRYLSAALAEEGFTTEPLSLFAGGQLRKLPDRLELAPGTVVIHLSEDANAGQKKIDRDTTDIAAHNARVLSRAAAKVVYFSSAAVYDTSTPAPHSENSIPNANTPYARFKRRIEETLDSEKDLILRPSNLYCQVAKSGTILGDLFSSAQATGRPQLRDPLAEADFIHLKYIADFIVRAIQRDLAGTFNAASGILTTGTELIEAATGNHPAEGPNRPSPFDNRKFLAVLGEARLTTVIDDLLNGEVSCWDE